MKRFFKRIFLVFLLFVVSYCIWQRELVAYGFRQAKGQIKVLREARPVAKVMADVTFPDSLKAKIRLIQEIKKFAIDSLGLEESGSYEKLYDQKGKPLVWVVVGAKKYALEPKTWDFPILGRFYYKGHFDITRIKNEASDLQKLGYDTQINEVSAWSTLGILNDPILSSMLERSEGQLAALIIHELTHGTLFTGTDLTFNENLADFVGDYGAEQFLIYKYGKNSPQLKRFVRSKQYYDAYTQHIILGTAKLDSLYKSFDLHMAGAKKDSLKKSLINQIVTSADTLLSGQFSTARKRFDEKNLPNNAYFIGFMTYRSKQNAFEDEFKRKFAGNFKTYLKHLKREYPAIF